MGTADKIGTAFRCLTLPRETRPLRFPHQGDVQQTAVFKLFNEGILEHNPQTSDNFLVSGFLLCPSPVYPVWTTQLSTLSQVWATASWAPVIDNNSATLNGFTEFTLSSYTIPGHPKPAIVNTIGSSGVATKLIYCPRGCSAALSITGATSSSTALVALKYNFVRTATDESEVYTRNMTLASGTASVVITPEVASAGGGWFQLISAMGNAAWATSGMRITITVTLDANERYLLPAPGFPMSQAALQSIRSRARVTASSLLLTNTSAMVQRGGILLGGRMRSADNTIWTPSTWVTTLEKLPRQLRYRGPGEKGLYTYTVPCELTMQFQDYVPSIVAGQPSDPIFNLGDIEYVNIGVYMGSQTTNVSGSALSSQEFSFQYDEHLEGISNEQIYSLGVPAVSLEAYQKALNAAVKVTPFTENPMHMAEFGKIARNLARPHVPSMKSMTRQFANFAVNNVERALDYI